MFTVNRFLESWLVTPYSESGHAEVEPVVGGKYELFWDPTNRENNSTLGCKTTAIEPDEFLAFDWKGPAEFKHFMNDADPVTHAVVFFLPVGNDSEPWTDVHLIHSGWRNSPEWEEARVYFQKAWGSALSNFAKKVNG